MKILTIAAVLATAVLPAHAADGLPKEFWGKWCAVETTTGGGGPRFWHYARTCDSDREDSRLADRDMTLGPRRMNNCKAVAFVEWKQEGAPQYIVTYRCKDGSKYAAMLDLNTEGNLTAQYYPQ
jgi:hypothetical protein